jgi:hypothetical protein
MKGIQFECHFIMPSSAAPAKPALTTFVCPLRYKNELPGLPFDPKMLDFPFDADRLFVYRPNTLEKEEKHQILTEPDLGVPINQIDPLAYVSSVYHQGNPLSCRLELLSFKGAPKDSILKTNGS